MMTMHTRPRQTDRRTDEHHGNCVTIRSMNASDAKMMTDKQTLLILQIVNRGRFVLLTLLACCSVQRCCFDR